jgi:hypothetical protein
MKVNPTTSENYADFGEEHHENEKQFQKSELEGSSPNLMKVNPTSENYTDFGEEHHENEKQFRKSEFDSADKPMRFEALGNENYTYLMCGEKPLKIGCTRTYL